jgi:hypothetical protein
MSRRSRATLSAVLAALALVATLPVPCACLPEPVLAGGHGCCPSEASVRSAEPGCCAAATPAPDTTAATPTMASAATVAVTPALVAVVFSMPATPPRIERPLAAPERQATPPPTVRRL